MAGMLGCGGGPPTLFLPSRCFEAAGLEEGAGDHGHQGVSVNPVRIPTQAGRGYRFEAGQGSDLKPARVPI